MWRLGTPGSNPSIRGSGLRAAEMRSWLGTRSVCSPPSSLPAPHISCHEKCSPNQDRRAARSATLGRPALWTAFLPPHSSVLRCGCALRSCCSGCRRLWVFFSGICDVTRSLRGRLLCSKPGCCWPAASRPSCLGWGPWCQVSDAPDGGSSRPQNTSLRRSPGARSPRAPGPPCRLGGRTVPVLGHLQGPLTETWEDRGRRLLLPGSWSALWGALPPWLPELSRASLLCRGTDPCRGWGGARGVGVSWQTLGGGAGGVSGRLGQSLHRQPHEGASACRAGAQSQVHGGQWQQGWRGLLVGGHPLLPGEACR